MIKIYSVTLVYVDSSTWYAGQFNSLDEANTWINNEKAKPYWNAATTVQIVEIDLPDNTGN
jgi:hypothetical protein